MSRLFITVLNMSLTASYVAAAVILARLLLKKAPKIFSYALWAVVLFRMVCPFSFESILSILPAKIETIPQDIATMQTPAINSGIAFIDTPVNQTIQNVMPTVQSEAGSINPMQIAVTVGTYLWLCGIIFMTGYAVISYIRIKRRIFAATLIRDNIPCVGNIFECEHIKTPFVIGFIKPKIYIPLGLDEKESDYIINHEQTHIKRKDYLIKPFAYLALAAHWFNPLMWVSFILMSKDMEMSCDESVMRRSGEDIRANYSKSLLSLSAKRSGLPNPLAFGESNVRARIKNVLNFRKHSRLIIVLAAVLAVAVTVGCAMNRAYKNELPNLENIQYPTGSYGEFLEYRTDFMSATDGWFIGNYGVALGKQENYIYLTHDGGNTWQETNNVNDEWSRVLTCGGFADDKTGFLCFRYDIENMGRIYCTDDGGKTWKLFDIPLLNELVGDGIGEAREISFGGGEPLNTVNITYFASKTDVDNGELYYINGIWNGTNWDFAETLRITGEKAVENVETAESTDLVEYKSDDIDGSQSQNFWEMHGADFFVMTYISYFDGAPYGGFDYGRNTGRQMTEAEMLADLENYTGFFYDLESAKDRYIRFDFNPKKDPAEISDIYYLIGNNESDKHTLEYPIKVPGEIGVYNFFVNLKWEGDSEETVYFKIEVNEAAVAVPAPGKRK